MKKIINIPTIALAAIIALSLPFSLAPIAAEKVMFRKSPSQFLYGLWNLKSHPEHKSLKHQVN